VPKPLVIVESPAKARTIAGFLGDGYVVESSVGHIRDLPANAAEIPKKYKGTEAGRLGIDVDNHFMPIYVVHKQKKEVVRTLKAALKDASELYLATDEDREGEAIAWHVLEELKPTVPVKRMVFHEITRSAIEEAISQPRELDMKLVEAQEGRRVLDRLVGYEISPVLWKKIMPKLSAGRVQSVATRLIVERERERMAFRSGEWWDLQGVFAADDANFEARLVSLDGAKIPTGKDFDAATGRPVSADLAVLDEAGATSLADRIRDAAFAVASVESRPWTEKPKPPFITSTLQQEAGRKLRFSASRAMAVAQRLYERGYITYMRTDSTNLSEQAISATRAQIGQMYGADYVPDAPRTYRGKVKNAQEAHEAIRPAGDAMRLPDQAKAELDADEQKVYELVWMRTIASQMPDARGSRITVRLEASSTNSERVEFQATGKTIEFPGYLRAYVEGSDDPDADLEDQERPMPALTEGQSVTCRELQAGAHATQPPARYTEASLVKELEERGIGRPSTYASVIQTVQDRGYVWKKGSALVPSWVGFATTKLLEQHFGDLVDYGFTAMMEEDLDQIARNEGEVEKWLRAFYFGDGSIELAAGHAGLKELVSSGHLEEIDARQVNSIPLGEDEDGNEIVVRVGRYGPYLQRGDDTAPLPDDLAPDELTILEASERLARGADGGRVLGTDPETELEVVARDGRFGPYIQLGEHLDDGTKPKTGSLFGSMNLDTITFEEAMQLLSLPRVVGTDADGVDVTAQNGRYGPYIKKGSDSRSIDTEEQLLTMTMLEAEAIFAQPKARGRRQKPPIAELGPHPDSGDNIRVLEGRFGPYVTDGTLNATIPRGRTPEEVTLDEAVALLRARAERGPVKPRKKAAKKKPAKKKATAKKPAKKAAKKRATKKAAAPVGLAVANEDEIPPPVDEAPAAEAPVDAT
jgi:DNA topoisomerase-1